MSLHPNLDELLKKRNRTPEEDFLLFAWERLEDWNDTAVYSKVRTLFLSLLDKEAERVMRGAEKCQNKDVQPSLLFKDFEKR